MKKLVLVIAILFLMTGCEVNSEYSDDKNFKTFNTYIDSQTCVEYFVSDGYYNQGTVTPKYNADGTLKQNAECLEKQE